MVTSGLLDWVQPANMATEPTAMSDVIPTAATRRKTFLFIENVSKEFLFILP